MDTRSAAILHLYRTKVRHLNGPNTMRMRLPDCFGGGVFAAAVLLASTASAIPIATVGSIDVFLQSAELQSSGENTEQAWAASVLGVTVNSLDYTQLQGSGSSAWEPVTGGPAGTNLYAIDFQSFGLLPTYFLVKTGNLGVTSDDHFLYSNLGLARYGVIDLNAFGDDVTILAGKISHAGVAGGIPVERESWTSTSTSPSTPMPEPTTLLLLGSGLALVARQIRRRTSR